MLERRAREAARLGVTSAGAAARWLTELERRAARGEFLMTLNYYGAAGVKPAGPRAR